ncbi:MAG: ABC transporter substrate-binding protein [Burkholderiaceae bacterium]|jgi:branched-chain amino acid transport system substrate-binding protein
MHFRRTLRALALMVFLGASVGAAPAFAQIKIGMTLSTTGPAASIGAPSKNVALMWPKEIAGQKIEYFILDDGSNPTGAVVNIRKLTSEDKVDVVIGSNTTPNAMAMIDVASESQTPMIALAASASIVAPMDAKRAWVFKMPQNDSLMATAVTQHMENNGVKTLAFIGFSDGYGESWFNEVNKLLDIRHIKLVANERYGRADTSVTGQVVKIMAANPDAVLIAGAGTPAATPEIALVQRGYKGKIYQTHGIATYEFLKVGGKDVEGTYFPTGPAVVAKQLPDSQPAKKVAVEFVKRYELLYGPDSVTQFAADAWGAWMLLADAIPRALRVAQPGTPEFRKALRDALESTRDLTVPQGVINMTPNDHVGLDQRARVMARIENGKWKFDY